MNTALYDEYKALCFVRGFVPRAGSKFERVGGDASLLRLILGMRAPPPVEVPAEVVVE